MPKKQKCTIGGCGKDSIPGLRAGHGKCQYHWNAGVWGKKWADECEQRKEVSSHDQTTRPTPNHA